ncbi:MAG: histidine kinase [Rhodopirellula sp.]|nr:histidine kinase [Rhodopirellula sp.]OUX51000.1 MAG: histidine kinase [Rhodopirellula sp. TMED283]
MVTTVEISMYPFVKNFRDLIKEFIGKLTEYGEIEVHTGPTCTILMGDHDQVMNCLTEMTRWSYQQHGQSVFVTKILPGYEPT